MSDRLTELQRQRAIIQGHLAWLDQEIAASRSEPTTTSFQSPVSFQPSPPAPVATQIAPLQDADELIAKFGSDVKNSAQSARRGCFMVFSLSFVLFGLIVYGLYLYSRGLHETANTPATQAVPESPAKR